MTETEFRYWAGLYHWEEVERKKKEQEGKRHG